MNINFNDYPIVRTIEGTIKPSLTEKDSTDTDNIIIIEGWAPSGTKTADEKWILRKTTINTTGAVETTTIEFPNASDRAEFAWDDRATLSWAQ